MILRAILCMIFFGNETICNGPTAAWPVAVHAPHLSCNKPGKARISGCSCRFGIHRVSAFRLGLGPWGRGFARDRREVSFLLRSNAQRIVARVVGSWITAIAILVLSLRIVAQITVG
jgi:hypothetical protein